LCIDRERDPNVERHDYDKNYSYRIQLDIIDKEIDEFHRVYDFVIVQRLERIFYIFDNDMYAFDDDYMRYVEMKLHAVFDYECKHDEYNQMVYRIIEHRFRLNNEILDSNNELNEKSFLVL